MNFWITTIRTVSPKAASGIENEHALTAVRILGICEKINEELEQKQKIYVIIQLIEYIAYGIEIREKELDFLQTVASAFNIPEDEYQNILNFVHIRREGHSSEEAMFC